MGGCGRQEVDVHGRLGESQNCRSRSPSWPKWLVRRCLVGGSGRSCHRRPHPPPVSYSQSDASSRGVGGGV
eukprot:9310151-Pyramimonas_sp.AAC.1